MNSLVRLEKTLLEKNVLACYNVGVAVVNFEVVGLAPDFVN
jgi:hypothetical protein